MASFKQWMEGVDSLGMVDRILNKKVVAAIGKVFRVNPGISAERFAQAFQLLAKDTFVYFEVGKDAGWGGVVANAGADILHLKEIKQRLEESGTPMPTDINELIDLLESKGVYAKLFQFQLDREQFAQMPSVGKFVKELRSVLAHEITHIAVGLTKLAGPANGMYDNSVVHSQRQYVKSRDEPESNVNSVAWDIVNKNYGGGIVQRQFSIYPNLDDNDPIKRKFYRNLFKLVTTQMTPNEYKKRLARYTAAAAKNFPYDQKGFDSEEAVGDAMRQIRSLRSAMPIPQRAALADRARLVAPEQTAKIDMAFKDIADKGGNYPSPVVVADAKTRIAQINAHPNIPPERKVAMIAAQLDGFAPQARERILMSVNINPALAARL